VRQDCAVVGEVSTEPKGTQAGDLAVVLVLHPSPLTLSIQMVFLVAVGLWALENRIGLLLGMGGPPGDTGAAGWWRCNSNPARQRW
jgi:hypothetical protein